MKNIVQKISILAIFIAILIGCSENSNVTSPSSKGLSQEYGNDTKYVVSLVQDPYQDTDGNWVWEWQVVNTAPGNGLNGTQQALSHLDLIFGLEECAGNWSNVVSAGVKNYGATAWTDFTPTYQEDMSLRNSGDCYRDPVLKFSVTTNGSNASYFRLVLNDEFEVDETSGGLIMKYANKCSIISFPGIGCPPEDFGIEEICYYNSSETAWSAGTRFNTKGNWATYSTYTGGTKTYDLYAGQSILVGSVTVEPAIGGVNVTYSLNGTWGLSEYHLHLATSVSGIPQANNKNPIPGQFKYKGSYELDPDDIDSTYPNTVTVFVPWSGSAIVAAHAVVQERICE
ncbi:hypothetical protein MASR1M45_16930 [Candidatus Kapaibacterium sp.]